jgi:hypothetical protein
MTEERTSKNVKVTHPFGSQPHQQKFSDEAERGEIPTTCFRMKLLLGSGGTIYSSMKRGWKAAQAFLSSHQLLQQTILPFAAFRAHISCSKSKCVINSCSVKCCLLMLSCGGLKNVCLSRDPKFPGHVYQKQTRCVHESEEFANNIGGA